jgi:hypothetical protein
MNNKQLNIPLTQNQIIMKKTISILLVGMMLAITNAFANDGKYIEVMQKNIMTVYTAQTIPDLQAAVNSLERIASAEKTKWEPYYYVSFGYIMMANREQDGAKKDGYLDLALAAVEKGKELAPAESEIIALEGFVHMLRITVDPASRGQKYSGLAYKSFGKAVAMNENNPRALSLLAQMQFGTAEFFNSPTTEACATLSNAVDKFATFKAENPLAPQWGKKMTEDMKAKCN